MINLTTEIKNHIQMNVSTEDYNGFDGVFEKRDNNWGYFVNFEKLREWQLRPVYENIEIIEQRKAQRDKIKVPTVGDIIRHKYGKMERITYIWEDSGQAQAGGGSGSFYMNQSGYASYSGSLNSGVNISQLKNSGEKKDVCFWFFSRDWSGGNRGINFYCPVTIWDID